MPFMVEFQAVQLALISKLIQLVSITKNNNVL